jgi:hypothetical protein
MAVSKHWCELELDDTNKHEDFNPVFANHGEEDEIYPLTTMEIAKAQRKIKIKDILQTKYKNIRKGYVYSIYLRHKSDMQRWQFNHPSILQHKAVSWYHHYLQHLATHVSKRQ